MPEQIDNVWARAKRMAFWDQGLLTQAQWTLRIKQLHANTLLQSIDRMRACDFIVLVSKTVFLKRWPQWRTLATYAPNKRIILDAVWARDVMGDVSAPVCEAALRFHPKRQATLRLLAGNTDITSIYDLAKRAGRNYRRVHDDVMAYEAAGIVALVRETRGGRTVKVPKVHGVHC
jgi:hypothetical protein